VLEWRIGPLIWCLRTLLEEKHMLVVHPDGAIIIAFIAGVTFLLYSRILLKSAIAEQVSKGDLAVVWILYLGSVALLVSSSVGLAWILWTVMH
jgi:hypothetical protein